MQADKGFCGPSVLTAAYPDFMACEKFDTDATCVGSCQWYEAGMSTCTTAQGTRPVECPTATWNIETCVYDCDTTTGTGPNPDDFNIDLPVDTTVFHCVSSEKMTNPNYSAV
jgi:hypothetical protein